MEPKRDVREKNEEFVNKYKIHYFFSERKCTTQAQFKKFHNELSLLEQLRWWTAENVHFIEQVSYYYEKHDEAKMQYDFL